MRGFRMRFTCLACVFALCFGCFGAAAEFSPRYEKLKENGGATLSLTGQLSSMEKLSKASLEAVNEWLGGMEATLSVGKDTRAEVTLNGDTVLDVTVSRQSGYTVTAFGPDGGAYLTDPDGPDALSLLTGRLSDFPGAEALPAAYAAMAPWLYAVLGESAAPKRVKEPTSIKNAAASAAYENYTFKNGALNGIWPQVLDAVLPELREALKSQPAWYADAEELLRGLEFSGECRFKRFLDKEGGDLGMQFTGWAARGEDKRKVTLFGGYTPGKGGSFSLNLPAVSGKNSLKASLAVKMTEKNGVNTLSFEAALTRNMNGEKLDWALEGSLKNVIREDAEKWTGKVTITETQGKTKTSWVLNPDLQFTEEGLSGTVTVQKKEGSALRVKAVLQVKMGEYKAFSAPRMSSAKDLRGLGEERARAAVTAELIPLSGTVAELILRLPEDQRALLTHELRTEEWMNGPEAPVPEQGSEPADSWVVEEDDQQ